MLTLTILVLSSVFAEARGGENPNLIRNPSFESPIGDAWTGIACSLEEHSGDKTHGKVSAICKDRNKDQAGPEQVLPSLIPGHSYELSADVKLLNDHPNKLFQKFKATINFQFNETALRGVDSRQPELSAKKPPSCKGLKGEPRTKCLAQRASWKDEMKKRREEKLKKKQERKRLKEERRKKNKQRKKEKMERKKKKKAEQEKARKEQERKRKQKKREKQKRDKEKRRRRKPRRQIDRHREARSLRRHVTDHVTAAGDGSRRQVLPPLSRQRRQVRRQRVEPPKTIHRKGRRKIYPEDAEPKPASGAEEEEGTFIVAWRAWATTDKGWIKLKGSISTPMVAFNASVLRIQGPDPECNFLIDNVRFVEIDENPDWLAESRVRIDTHRKSDIELKVHIPDDVPKAELDIQVRLKKHLFAFGSKVEDKFLRGHKTFDKKFQELFHTLFNWATLGSFKWRFDKGKSLYEPDFSDALGGLDKLREHGIKVRAHSILWGVEKNVPDAVIKTPPGELQAVVDFHTEYMVNITRGRVDHWDVQNELLHGHWYEETLKDPDFSKNLFKHVRRLDPYPKLYLNDFQGVTAGGNTEDLYDTAMDFIAAGTGIQGLGIQGHTKEFTLPHPTLMWRRLDRLQQTGLDIFMTEFDVGWLDDVVRADWFEDAMRAFYAHPALSGVILWGFWEHMQRFKHKYLIIGHDFQFAEPGQRWVCLVKKEWTTNESFNMADLSGDTIQLRGFQGDYEVVVRRNGVPVRQKNFTLGTRHKSVSIHVSRHGDPIELTEERDYVPECISHRDRKSLGEVYTTSSNRQLSCFEKGPDQAPSGASRVTATCPSGSVMIGCSSYSKARSSKFWHGEEIQIEGGVAICSAHIDPSAGADPTVKALCCDQKDLTCDYRQAGPSFPMKGAMAEATCPTGHTALACTASSEYSHIGGSYPNANLTSCRAVKSQSSSKDPRSQAGVVSGAVCCKSRTALRCRTVTSAPSAPNKQWVNVTCPSGYDVMTGCHAHALSGGTAGSYVYKRDGPMSCSAAVAEDHPEKDGAVVAVAVCCRP